MDVLLEAVPLEAAVLEAAVLEALLADVLEALVAAVLEALAALLELVVDVAVAVELVATLDARVPPVPPVEVDAGAPPPVALEPPVSSCRTGSSADTQWVSKAAARSSQSVDGDRARGARIPEPQGATRIGGRGRSTCRAANGTTNVA